MINKKLIIIIAVIMILLILTILATLIIIQTNIQVENNDKLHDPEFRSHLYWESAEPLGIIEWGFNSRGDRLRLVLRNNTLNTLLFRKMTIASGKTIVPDMNVASGSTQTIEIFGLNCTPGEKYSFPKEDIEILYDTNHITGNVHKALADIIGTC